MSGSVCDLSFLEAEKFETEYWLTTVSLYINTTKGGFVEKNIQNRLRRQWLCLILTSLHAIISYKK
jgi:hypothetical protein